MNSKKRPDMVSIISCGAKEKLCAHSTSSCLNPMKHKILSSLSWRDLYCNSMYFRETINSMELYVKQLKNGEETGIGTGASVWPAACLLMKCIEFRYGEKLMKDKFVLELGAGTGAVGIATSFLGANVYMSDLSTILFLIKENTFSICQKYQYLSSKLRILEFEWGKHSIDQLNLQKLDYVVVSDCILPKLYPMEPLIQVLDSICTKYPSIVIIISYEHRYYEQFHPKHKFFQEMSIRNFHIDVLKDHQLHPNYKANDIEVWELYKQKKIHPSNIEK